MAVAESTLSPLERVRFLNLCEARSAAELAADADRVEAHVSLLQAANTVYEMVDFELAEAVGQALLALIAEAPRFSFEERRLLCGAIEYFVMTGDVDNDMASPLGLVDDARVVNATAMALGHQELTIAIAE